MTLVPVMPSRAMENSLMAFTPPRFALFAVPMLALMGCTMQYELSEVRAEGVPTAEQQAQCERMDHMLGDRTLSPQQLEAVRGTMNTHGCEPQ
jgi:hypothetical protein